MRLIESASEPLTDAVYINTVRAKKQVHGNHTW